MVVGTGTVELFAFFVQAVGYVHQPTLCNNVRPGQRDVYFDLEYSELAYKPSLENIRPTPFVCEVSI